MNVVVVEASLSGRSPGSVATAAEAALGYGFTDFNGKEPTSLREQKGSPRAFFKKG
jgi:hypothetical protein